MNRESFITGKKRKLFSIVILIFLAFLVRCLFFNGGVRGSDAYAYSLYAHQIETGQYQLTQINSHFGFRYILLITTALSYSLFGVNDVSSSLFPFFFSLLNIFFIFLIGEKIFGQKVALIGGILLIFYPLDVIMASFLGPDSFTPLFSSLVVLCYIIAEEKKTSTAQSISFFILSGFFIGLSVSARETSIFLYGVLLLYQIIRRQKIYPFLWISVGLTIPLIGEAAYYYVNTGDPMLRIYVLDNLKMLIKKDYSESAGSLLYYPRMMFGLNLQGWAIYGLTWWLVLAGLVWAGMKKDKKILFPALWLILPFLGFEFGLQSFKDIILISKNYNYLSLITPPAMLISAYFLTETTYSLILNKNKREFIMRIAILAIACMNLYGTHRFALNIRDDAAPYIEVASYLRDKPRQAIYIHSFRWSLFLRYFLNYDPSLDFRMIDDLEDSNINEISKAYVIFHKRYLEADIIGRRYDSPPWYAQYFDLPPPGWMKVISFIGEPPYNSVNMYYAK